MNINEFLEKQDELWSVYEKAKEAHPKPMKAKSSKNKGSRQAKSHEPGTKKDCEQCKSIHDAVVAINKHDEENLGMTRIEMTNTKNAVTFIRNVIKMMKEGGEL